MKTFNLNSYTIIYIAYIIFIISQINSQRSLQSEEKELLNNCISSFNKTESRFSEISQKMKNIKYNIFLKIRYKNLERMHSKIQISITEIREKLDSTNYDKNKIIEQLKMLDGNIEKYERKCDSANDLYYQAENIKAIVYNLIKAFFMTLLIIIIVVMIIIGIVSFFIIRRQKKYHTLEEEHTQSDIEINVENNMKTDQIKLEEKLDNQNEKGNSSEREIKTKKKIKKKKSESKEQKSHDEEEKKE